VERWHAVLAVGALSIVVCYGLLHLGSAWDVVRISVYCSANAAMMAGALVAARRHRAVRPAMLFLAAAGAAYIFGDVAFYLLALSGAQVKFPSLADVGYVTSYPLSAVALLLIARRRSPGRDTTGIIDAAIVGVGGGYLFFEFAIAPASQVAGSNLARLTSVAFPVLDLVLLMVGARLMLGAGARTTSLRLIGGYLVVRLITDACYTVTAVNGTYVGGHLLEMMWMCSSLMMAAATQHPDLARTAAPTPSAAPDASPARLAVLAVAAVIAPTTMTVQSLCGAEPHLLIAGVACNVLFLLVLGRMAGLIRSQRHAAITDALTGLRSRRFFEQALHAESSRSIRNGSELSMLLVDIDHFKSVNDTFGHNGGDRVLVEVAQRLGNLIRPGDLVARYGGEEFVVLLPGASPAVAREVGERLRHGVASTPIAVGESRTHRVTISVGVSGMPSICSDANELVLAADQALYAAKGGGRDRVESAADLMPV
jgi:two-component system cell cycle response regulator